MPYKEYMYNKHGEEIDTAPFVFNTEIIQHDNYKEGLLTIKPLDPYVQMTSEYYETDENGLIHYEGDVEHIPDFKTSFFYDTPDDELTLNVHNGFDVALFNICSLLGIGQFTLHPEVPYRDGVAPIHDKVNELKFTESEFKDLDGHVALFKFTDNDFILFKGLLLGANYVNKNIEDYVGVHVPRYDDTTLKKGANMFLTD